MKKLILLPLFLLFLSSGSSAHPLQTVSYVDLERYSGKWYEIAKFPNRFQRNCNEATAEYTPLSNGKIVVHNACKNLKTGRIKDIVGIAKVKDSETNAKLSVSFLPAWLRWTGIGLGKYWIIDLEQNYQYAVVSEPKRKYLWILSRTPSLDRKTYDSILEKIASQRLEVKRIEFSRENAVID